MNNVGNQTSTLRAELVKYLRANAHVENGFDETQAIRDVYAAPRLTQPLAELLTKLHGQSRYNNEFDEEWAPPTGPRPGNLARPLRPALTTVFVGCGLSGAEI